MKTTTIIPNPSWGKVLDSLQENGTIRIDTGSAETFKNLLNAINANYTTEEDGKDLTRFTLVKEDDSAGADVIIGQTSEEILERYNYMLDKVVETLNDGHTVEFVNALEIQGNNKLQFHFYKWKQVIGDLNKIINLQEFHIHNGSRKFIISNKYVKEFVNRDHVKKLLVNWKEAYYPDFVFEMIASEHLIEGEIISYLNNN